jgi:uncharacterized Zn-binding protein involved in type VI secretion
MGKALITVSATTSHGGSVIQGSARLTINGITVACVGDKVTCPTQGHGGTTTIVSGDPTMILNGKAVARHGDKTACGAVLIASQALAIDDN